MRFALALVALISSASALAFGARPDSTEWHTRGPALRGDVTGDGKLDTAVIEYAAPRTCRFRLLVRTETGDLSAPVRPEVCDGKPSEVYSGPDPHVDVLADINGKRGLEIVVQVGHGAHTEFADIWAVRAGRLRRFSGTEPHISYGGSAGTGVHVVDCAREPGVVLESTRVDRPPARIVRVWFRPAGLRLRPLRERTIRWPAGKAVPFREFGYPQPFPTCAKVRAPR